MANRRKEVKDVYVGMFGYDIAMYGKYVEELAKSVKSTPMATKANVENANLELNNATKPIPSTTSMPQIQSHADDYSIMAMGKDMYRLLTVFGEVEQEERKCTSLWSRLYFHVLSVTAEA